jgi:hypothetical protein
VRTCEGKSQPPADRWEEAVVLLEMYWSVSGMWLYACGKGRANEGELLPIKSECTKYHPSVDHRRKSRLHEWRVRGRVAMGRGLEDLRGVCNNGRVRTPGMSGSTSIYRFRRTGRRCRETGRKLEVFILIVAQMF